jgi:hypothetical protein
MATGNRRSLYNLLNKNLAHGEVYLIQVYVIKFVSDNSYLHLKNWPPRYNWSFVESGVKYHTPPPLSEQTSQRPLRLHVIQILYQSLSEWVIVVEHHMNNFSTISWREWVTFDELNMMSALYKTNTLSWILNLASPLKQHSVCRLNVACLAEKQQIPIS